MSQTEPSTAAPNGGDAPSTSGEEVSTARKVINTIGVDNLSLLLALILIVAVVVWLQPLFLSWQNLMNSLSQSIVIVGLMAIGQTVVIVAGMLDISVGSMASVASVSSRQASGVWLSGWCLHM